MRKLALGLLLFLAACSRPLTVNERSFAATLQGETFHPSSVRIVGTDLIGTKVRLRPARPQVACRERIWPPPQTPVVETAVAAVVLFESGLFRLDLYREDFLEGYPQTLPLPEAMLFAHEMTHVWQWQNRDLTGYHPLRAASEHKPGADPYLFEVDPNRTFLDYSDEQQASIVEEFVCCRSLDPEGERTQRLYDMLSPIFDGIERQSRVDGVWVPWKDANFAGICSD